MTSNEAAMSGRKPIRTHWFRSYSDKLDNPKILRLSDALYRAWDGLLCVACRYGGVLPPLPDLAFLLRRTPAAMARLVEALIRAGLLVRTERGLEPHDWSQWQYQSDVSTERVNRFRERQAATGTPAEPLAPATPPENGRESEWRRWSGERVTDAVTADAIARCLHFAIKRIPQ